MQEAETEALETVVSQLQQQMVSVDNFINNHSDNIAQEVIDEWKKAHSSISRQLKTVQTQPKKAGTILESVRNKFTNVARILASESTISHFIVSVLVMFTSSIAVYFALGRSRKSN